jgi:uncharacterized RDD family membrane protein YckC
VIDGGNSAPIPGSAGSPPMPPPIPMPPAAPLAAPAPVTWAPSPAATTTRPVPGAPGLEYAGALPRVAAYFLDSLLATIVAVVAGLVVALTIGSGIVTTVVVVVVQMAYFVGGWRTTGRATPGMRAFKLQIGQVDTGQPISAGNAVVRWFALSGWLSIASFLAVGLTNLVELLGLVWAIVLLVSVNGDAERRGLHDRVSGTAIVRPVGQSDTAAWIVVSLLLVLPVIAILAVISLIFLGAQVSQILSTVGSQT